LLVPIDSEIRFGADVAITSNSGDFAFSTGKDREEWTIMSTWLKVSFVLAVIMIFVPMTAFAAEFGWEEEDDYEWKTWKTHRSHGGFSGFAGFYTNVQTFESNEFTNLALDMGLDEFDDYVFCWGGHVMGHVGNGWRLGGGGHGGEVKTEGVVVDGGTEYYRSLEIGLGMGGVTVEYSPWMFGPVNLGLGSTIGGGEVSVVMSQDNGLHTWNKLRQPFTDPEALSQNVRTEIVQGFFMAEPYVTVRIHILDWMALSGTAGWTLTSLQSDKWMFNEEDIGGRGPDMDLNRPFYRIGLVLGG